MPADPTDVFADRLPPRGRRRRPLAILLVVAAACLVALWVAKGRRTGGSGGEPDGVVDTDRYLYPPAAAADPRTGEEVAPFTGFAIAVDTVPAVGVVTIDGVLRGEAPVLAGLDCDPGTKVPIRVEKAGFRPAQATTTCRADALVKLTVRLAP